MDCTDDKESFQRSYIAEEILSLPAQQVLRYSKVKDPLSLRLNLIGSLKNWKDVADLLGYSTEKIFGLFAHYDWPALKLLEDWLYQKNGRLERLVDVFTKLELYDCLEVVYECVKEYEEAASVNNNKPKEDDNDSNVDFQGNHKEKYQHGTDSSMSTASSITTGSCTMGTSTDYSTEEDSSMMTDYSSTSSCPPSETCSVATDSADFSVKVEDLSSVDSNCSRESEGKCVSCDNLNSDNGKHSVAMLQKPEFLRVQSWSGTGHVDKQPNLPQSMGGERSLFTRSFSQPNDMKSKVGAETKRKSFRKRIARLFKKPKQHKKSPIQSMDEMTPATSTVTTDSSHDMSTTKTFTVTGSYSEPSQKPCENLSPLKVEEARRLSLTDSLSSGESVSSPTSPGYESGYMSSEGPSVSSGKSISIIHCSDLEEESYQTEVLKLYDHFSEKLGYKCHLDKLEMWKIAENKFRYALRRVQHSDFVFICVSPELKRIFDSSLEDISEQLEDDGNCILRLESDLILSDLANHGSNRKGKFMTIILAGSSKRDVPCFLESYMKYQWPKDERKIRCIIEEQPEIIPVPVSSIKTDPPSQVVRPAGLI